MRNALYRPGSIEIKFHDPIYGITEVLKIQWFRKYPIDSVLEGAQAGLSWITILRKRENYRQAFAQFDVAKVAAFTQRDIERCVANPGIVRNRLKINSAISNARYFLEVQAQFGSFSDYLWGYVDGTPIINRWTEHAQIPASTALSDTLSKELQRRGFSFFGSTICYAYLQAIGVVNDHITSCYRHAQCQ